jgi:hypothetical protein
MANLLLPVGLLERSFQPDFHDGSYGYRAPDPPLLVRLRLDVEPPPQVL